VTVSAADWDARRLSFPPAAKYFVCSEAFDLHAMLLEFHARDGYGPANGCLGLASTSA
jgi:hypothetical protein